MSQQIAFIQVNNLSKIYGLFSTFQSLTDVSLNINKGETFGLIGPNGAGKTTLMGCLLGLAKPSAGNIFIDNKSVDDISVKARTGFMPERPNFDAWMIVENFLHYHHMLARQPKSTASEDVAKALRDVGLEPGVEKKLIRKLSRGMLQRLGLAQLLIGKPDLCFLDEPTSGMDPLGMSLVNELLLRWKQEGKTVVINSHHLDQVERVCDRVAFIENGKIKSIEELVPTSQTKQVFAIHWAQPYPDDDLVRKIAQDNQIECEAIIEGGARFLLSNKSQASSLLRAFVSINTQIEQAAYEHKDLVELFKKGQCGTMSTAVILHSFLRLARPGTLMTLIMFVLVYPTAIIAFISRAPSVSFDFDAMANLIFGPIMITVVAFTFVGSSIGNTKSLDDGEYLALLFSRPIFRWTYIVSKWVAGLILVLLVIGLQVLVFMTLLQLIGRGNQLSVGPIDVANIILNSLQATALVVMIFAFPGRIGAMLFVGLLYISFVLPLMINAIRDSTLWFNGSLQSMVNFISGVVHSFTYLPVDLDPYFNSVQILWLPIITLVSNIALYLWIAIIVMNNREFFYTN